MWPPCQIELIPADPGDVALIRRPVQHFVPNLCHSVSDPTAVGNQDACMRLNLTITTVPCLHRGKQSRLTEFRGKILGGRAKLILPILGH